MKRVLQDPQLSQKNVTFFKFSYSYIYNTNVVSIICIRVIIGFRFLYFTFSLFKRIAFIVSRYKKYSKFIMSVTNRLLQVCIKKEQPNAAFLPSQKNNLSESSSYVIYPNQYSHTGKYTPLACAHTSTHTWQALTASVAARFTSTRKMYFFKYNPLLYPCVS